jgi:hypothetical protein
LEKQLEEIEQEKRQARINELKHKVFMLDENKSKKVSDLASKVSPFIAGVSEKKLLKPVELSPRPKPLSGFQLA